MPTRLYSASYLWHRVSPAFPVIAAVLVIYDFATLFKASMTDPGYIPREREDDSDDMAPLYRALQIGSQTVQCKWCNTCNFYRPPRAVHCSVCDNCVENFDHHCPWVGNCIAKRNYGVFVTWLFLSVVYAFYIAALCAVKINDKYSSAGEPGVHDLFSENWAEWTIIFYIAVLMIPVGGLACLHITLLYRGLTTNEMINGKYDKRSPYDRGACGNLVYILCGPRQPSFVRPRKKRVVQADGKVKWIRSEYPPVPATVMPRSVHVWRHGTSVEEDDVPTSICMQEIPPETPT
ncbi:hypothetical protein SARC_02233 [Sphaeroforma arctica JP610]|uniref:Palmitoyltransferase n=1 Tax=Sphaeroforma arctica JP610 TaxID=667725 RepID=A0A0L0G9B8_9EUKA|nr:hypothetical protein SARC_02233 [Sphaeroforma arctica JP610]KNC85575.1 hypothetical protein SARC_02233 [Sphaeroforma arctica JP610]|eukprot:XP_014159477.1 hypothetical protein SARC_02233 [Sphaeroforma arctica JP610]